MKFKLFKMNKQQITKIIKEDKYNKIEKEIKALGSLKILCFDITSEEELFSVFTMIAAMVLVIISLGLMNGASAKAILLLALGVTITCYVQYRKPIDNYKESFLKDNELPANLDTLISGLEVGMPLEQVCRYIKKNKKGLTANLISTAIDYVDAGIDFNKAINDVAKRSMNKYFIRMAKIINKTDNSVLGLAEQLKDLEQDIEEEVLNTRNEHANSLDNLLFFPMLIGYFAPSIIMIIVPFYNQFTKFKAM